MLHKHQQKGPNIVCIEWEKNDEHKRKKKKKNATRMPNPPRLVSTCGLSEVDYAG